MAARVNWAVDASHWDAESLGWWASSNYSRIFLLDGKNLLVTKLLREFEELLQLFAPGL